MSETLVKMDKERFHNALALALGYEQMLNDKRYKIIVDDNADEPKIVIEDENGYTIKFKVSEIEGIKQKGIYMNNVFVTNKKLSKILDAVHQAYIKATTNLF